MSTLTATDFDMQYDAEHNFHFIETEDATIMAWGHRDLEGFLDEVLTYDTLCDPKYAERGDGTGIDFVWAVKDEPEASDEDSDEEWWITWSTAEGHFTEATPNAFPVTIWRR